MCQPTSAFQIKQRTHPGPRQQMLAGSHEATGYRRQSMSSYKRYENCCHPTPCEDIRSCFLNGESGWHDQHIYPGFDLSLLSRSPELWLVLEMRKHNGAWPSARDSQHPKEVQRNPTSGDVDVEDFHFHLLSRTQAQAPSLLCLRQLRFCYASYRNQTQLPYSYIHKNPKQCGILDFACKNCPNL